MAGKRDAILAVALKLLFKQQRGCFNASVRTILTVWGLCSQLAEQSM
jgi:hypothetical protein